MWPNPQLPADLVTFTEEILNGKLHFLCIADNQNESARSFTSYVSYSLGQINTVISKLSETHSDARLQILTLQFQPIILLWNIFELYKVLVNVWLWPEVKQKNVKIGWRQSLVPTQTFRNKTLTRAISK